MILTETEDVFLKRKKKHFLTMKFWKQMLVFITQNRRCLFDLVLSAHTCWSLVFFPNETLLTSTWLSQADYQWKSSSNFFISHKINGSNSKMWLIMILRLMVWIPSFSSKSPNGVCIHADGSWRRLPIEQWDGAIVKRPIAPWGWGGGELRESEALRSWLWLACIEF